MAARLVSIPKKVNSPSLLFNYLVIHKTQKPSNLVMEVHHHPTLEKKSFKEYFLEFLMIFLAVTMGFFAENIREYMSDREKEQADIRSLAKNLRSDPVAIASSLQSIQWVKMKMDSLMELIKTGKYKEQQQMLYKLA